ncbi:MAG: hypothetical protein ACRDFS_12330 [Chloroflexota bacterium]
MDRLPPVEAAEALVKELFPAALATFVAGSVLRGAGTPTSDLDSVPWRQVVRGLLAEG